MQCLSVGFGHADPLKETAGYNWQKQAIVLQEQDMYCQTARQLLMQIMSRYKIAKCTDQKRATPMPW